MDALMTAASVGGGSGKRNLKLLWTNSSPFTDISNKTINLDLSKYNFLLVIFCMSDYSTISAESAYYLQATIIVQNSNYGNPVPIELLLGFMMSSYRDSNISAGIKGVKFEVNSSNGTHCIPFEIYGY